MTIPEVIEVRDHIIPGVEKKSDNREFHLVSAKFLIKGHAAVYIQTNVINQETERPLLPVAGYLSIQEFIVASNIFTLRPLSKVPLSLSGTFATPKDIRPRQLWILLQDSGDNGNSRVIRFTFAAF